MDHDHPCPRRLFVPLTILGSLVWLALIIASGALDLELPQSVGCTDPAAARLSLLRSPSGPCRTPTPLNPPTARRNHHDNHPAEPLHL